MTATCPQCSMGLNFDTTRLPSEPFTVLCPRCRQTVTVMPPHKEDGRLPGAPADPIPGAENGSASNGSSPGGGAPPDFMQTLVTMLSSAMRQPSSPKGDGDKWQRRRLLACMDDPQIRERVRNSLDPAKYEVFSADQATEAHEIIRDSRSEILALSPSFDAEHQGGQLMMQYVNRLTPQNRRRTYVILVSPQLRTMDTYLAFANGVNLTVHPEDIDSFQSILERSIRDFNELYRPLHAAMAVDPF
ncbi:MAG TPA: hypothetical protein VJX67_16655 [Blastocatellia bacterium]|nr:hypothetical protein [Blastocatellia bacterium]